MGINCGLGSHSLKIKEQLKEYCHNTDVNLCNITDDSKFLQDLRGISDEAFAVSTLRDLKDTLQRRPYQYIVWELPFLTKQKFKTLLECCLEALSPDGKLFLKLTVQNKDMMMRKYPQKTELGDDWIVLVKEHLK